MSVLIRVGIRHRISANLTDLGGHPHMRDAEIQRGQKRQSQWEISHAHKRFLFRIDQCPDRNGTPDGFATAVQLIAAEKGIAAAFAREGNGFDCLVRINGRVKFHTHTADDKSAVHLS